MLYVNFKVEMTWLLRSEVIGFIVVLFILLAWLLHQKNKRNNDLQKNKTIDQDKVYLEKKISPKKINKKLIYLTITIVILLAIYLMK